LPLAFGPVRVGTLAASGALGSGSASAAASSSSQAPRMQSSITPGSGTMLRQDTIETHITPL
jgi:hypothetical protein